MVVAASGAVVGAVVVVAAVSLLGMGARTTTTTVVQQAPLRAGSVVGAATTPEPDALTPRSLFERDAPSVVQVRADVVRSASDDPGELVRSTSHGSGFVVDATGHVLTAAHVVAGAVKVTVALTARRVVEADVVARDSASDLAVLALDADDERLRALTLGDGDAAQVGDPVVAIANPYGAERTLTQGVVSGRQPRVTAVGGGTIADVIQTDAAVDPAGSGGPILDAAGRVIGVATRLGDQDGDADETCVVVPIETAQRVLRDLGEGTSTAAAYLGVGGLTIDASLSSLALPTGAGVLVQSVQTGSPAAKAGIRAGTMTQTLPDGTSVLVGGDVVLAVDSRPVGSADDLAAALDAHRTGDRVRVDLLRGTTRTSVEVRLGRGPG